MKKIVVLVVSLWLLTTVSVQAQSKPKITITPAFKEVILQEKEARESFELEIQNDHTTPISFSVTAADFKGLDESGGLLFAGATGGNIVNKYGIAKWARVTPKTIQINPRSKRTVTITVDNLPSLTPGGHYGALFIEAISTPSNASRQARVSLKQTLTSLLFVKKVGGERYDLSLQQINYPKRWWQLPSEVRLRFYNPGNMYLTTRGRLQLMDPSGQVVREGLINEESGRLLPEQHRRHTVRLTSQQRAWRPGRYQLVTTYRYDGLDAEATKTTSFYYFPAYALVAVVGLMLIVIGAIRWFWLKYHDKAPRHRRLHRYRSK